MTDEQLNDIVVSLVWLWVPLILILVFVIGIYSKL